VDSQVDVVDWTPQQDAMVHTVLQLDVVPASGVVQAVSHEAWFQ